MIRRLLVLLLLAMAVMWWLKQVAAGSGRAAQRGGGPADGPRELGPMVRDRVCNTFLPRSRSLSLRVGAEEHHFCSEACRAKFLEQAKIRPA